MRSTPGPEPPLDAHTPAWRRFSKPASIAFLLVYYLYFVWHIFGARFSGDDMMNMDYYFKFSSLKLALIQWTPGAVITVSWAAVFTWRPSASPA